MLISILNWVLLAFLAVSNAAWIRLMLTRTGRCSYKYCIGCPYDGGCPMQEDKGKRARLT